MTTAASSAPWYASGDPWILTQTEWDPERALYYETIFTQSNGYMGLRGYTEEVNPVAATCREGYLAGVFGHMDASVSALVAVEYPWPMLQMLTLPELFGCTITLDGERFGLAEGVVESFSRSLDMRNGLLSRQVVWTSPKGQTTQLVFDRFLSAANPHLAMQEISVTPVNWRGEAVLETVLDSAVPSIFRCGDRSMPEPEQRLMEQVALAELAPGTAQLFTVLRGTQQQVCLVSVVQEAGQAAETERTATAVRQTVRLALAAGESRRVTHTVAVVSSRDGVADAALRERAAQVAGTAAGEGFGPALSASTAVWHERWTTSDITLDGPARDQAYVRFGTFSMLQMAPFHTETISIPARAYAFNRYHGLYYWDSETFLMPHYLHTHPDVARKLLRFRCRTLDGARRTARRLDSAGACYPWMTDADDGTEQAPWGIGDYLWHQNADIVYALHQYLDATGDEALLIEGGLELVLETARFWMSRMEEDDDGVVHLHNTVGPDELDNHGRDNGYTSLLARHHLRLVPALLARAQAVDAAAVQALLERLSVTADELTAWARAASRLAVPNVPGQDFPLQDEFLLAKQPVDLEGMDAEEGYAMRHTHRIVKQADIILAMYLLQDEFTTEQMRAAYDFYEPMCLHYSSLSYNTHSIIAGKIGREEQAYAYFIKAAGLDLDNLRNATKDGLHAAALAGTWQTVVFGFLHMRVKGDRMILAPRLPAAWQSVRLSLWFRGYRLALQVEADQVRVQVAEEAAQAPARLCVYGQEHVLTDGLSLAVQAGLQQSVG